MISATLASRMCLQKECTVVDMNTENEGFEGNAGDLSAG